MKKAPRTGLWEPPYSTADGVWDVACSTTGSFRAVDHDAEIGLNDGYCSGCDLRQLLQPAADILAQLEPYATTTTTPPSRPNKVGLKCPSAHPSVRTSIRPSVRPSTKSFFDFNEVWYVGRRRRVMHDGVQYDPIQGQGRGHEPLKVGNSTIFEGYILPVYN